MPEKLAQIIESLCKQRNITINAMLKGCDLPSSTYRNICIGSKPSIDKVEKIADYFGVPVDYLLGRTDNPSLSETDTATVSERAEIEEEFLAAFEKLTERQKAIALGYMERMAEENKQSKGEK